jgi:peptide chain release factor 2
MIDSKVIETNCEKLTGFAAMISAREAELAKLKTEQETNWADAKLNSKVKSLGDFVASYRKLCADSADFLELAKICAEAELAPEYERLNAEFNKFYLSTLMSGRYDENDCIVNITAGAGGTEAQDWADIVLRMLLRFAEHNDYKTEITDHLEGDGAGIKGASFKVTGINAYGVFKSESGVHRLVRISPFDANSRRHTSFCAVEIVPVIEKTSIVIEDKDLRIDVYRASGAGGQHVNRTESAVRITHLPTGTVCTCQNGRSQIQNRQTAMQNLISNLEFIHYENEQRKLKNLQPIQQKIEWGSQIRSYVMCPYTLVKDHRTGAETSNVQKVLDGDLKMFSDSYLLWLNAGSPNRK